MIRLCAIAELAEDTPLRVALDGRGPVAVYKVGDAVYVTDDTCTHGQASLAEYGELDGFVIACSWHDGAFDIRTGEVLRSPCTEALRVHEVTIRDGAVFIAA